RRRLAKPRTPPHTQAQAETLAIVAYLQPVSRPEIARIRGVSSESAVQTLSERGLIEESGRSRFGAVLHRTTPLFERVFGLASREELPPLDELGGDASDLRARLESVAERRGA
ncbi:MAG: SMC-Scp complex subunit ScpB, partial [Actinobacteria bacterium]|nr:SMC-Scp complex subunit ScpB [Actinomycetota bacterium]